VAGSKGRGEIFQLAGLLVTFLPSVNQKLDTGKPVMTRHFPVAHPCCVISKLWSTPISNTIGMLDIAALSLSESRGAKAM